MRLTRLIQAALLVFLGFSLLASLNTGLADNGDFDRVMTWFSSGPANMPKAYPALGSPEYHQRYFAYFIPEWRLDFPFKGIFSATELLWLPGVLLNWLFYSHTVLSMTMVGLIPRLLSPLILWLVFRWINHASQPPHLPAGLEPASGSEQALTLTLTLGVPLTLLLGSGAYVAYFNSFYQETGSFIFLFLFIAALVYTWQVDAAQPETVQKEGRSSEDGGSRAIQASLHPNLWLRFLALAALFGVLTSKASNIYWAIPGVLLVVPWRRVMKQPKAYLALIGALAATLALVAALLPSRPDLRQANVFQSLFDGALTFSKDPLQRLDELGIKGGKKCLFQAAFKPSGQACLAQFGDQISFLDTAQVILHEPLILFRAARFSAQNMQNLTPQLGKYARGATYPPRTLITLLGAWSSLKAAIFPRGLGLWATLVIFSGIFGVSLKLGYGMQRQLALLGLVATLACFVDMNVQVLGDGQADIIKHLFLANLLFDLAAIAALNLGVIYILNNRTTLYRIFRMRNR